MIVKTFILENWRLIIDILSVICVTIFFFIKKKPVKVIDSIQEWIYQALPGLINKAEAIYGANNGEEKMDFVIDTMVGWLVERYPGVDPKLYIALIERYSEQVLSTPQKKGEIEYGEK